MSKATLRQQFKAQRQRLDGSTISNQICHYLALDPIVQRASTILAYLAFSSEVSLTPLVQAWPEKQWGFPRCLPGSQLAWHPLSAETLLNLTTSPQLQVNRWGIPEPAAHLPEIDPARADLVLVPALACDQWGYRLGYGGGYYDRFLSQYTLATLGVVASACFLDDRLPVDPWDVRLHRVATDTGIFNVLDFENQGLVH